MRKDYSYCQIAFKILLRKGDKILFLRDAEKGRLDLPGGRANEDEDYAPLQKIIGREVKEELGSKIKYRLGLPIFQNRRYYPKGDKYVLITVYEAKYISGPIKLSFEHGKYQWIDPQNMNLKKGNFLTKKNIGRLKNI